MCAVCLCLHCNCGIPASPSVLKIGGCFSIAVLQLAFQGLVFKAFCNLHSYVWRTSYLGICMTYKGADLGQNHLMLGFSKSLHALIVLTGKCNAPVMINSKESGLRVGHFLLVPVLANTWYTESYDCVNSKHECLFAFTSHLDIYWCVE